MWSIEKWHGAIIPEMSPCQYVFGMAADTPARDQDKFVLRLPDGMRDRIAKAASAYGRSMNAEIVHTLQQKYNDDLELTSLAIEMEGLSRLSSEMSKEFIINYLMRISQRIEEQIDRFEKENQSEQFNESDRRQAAPTRKRRALLVPKQEE